jgi:hypothetical protein
MSAPDPRWRVSVATLSRVVVQGADPQAPRLLILERAATLLKEKDPQAVVVRVKPYGGAVRILDAAALRRGIGEFEFDSPHSSDEQDFRLWIPAAAWEEVKQFCLLHLQNPADAILETGPLRELAEEFKDALGIDLEPGQVFTRPTGFVVENTPAPTANLYRPGAATVRIYRIFEVTIPPGPLCTALLANSSRYSDGDLQALAAADAARGGKGRANAALALPLGAVAGAYRQVSTPSRSSPITLDGHLFDPSVIAVLEEVDAPQYERIMNWGPRRGQPVEN